MEDRETGSWSPRATPTGLSQARAGAGRPAGLDLLFIEKRVSPQALYQAAGTGLGLAGGMAAGDWHCTGHTVWAGTPHTTQTQHRDTYSTDTLTIHKHSHRHTPDIYTQHRHTNHTETQHSHTRYTPYTQTNIAQTHTYQTHPQTHTPRYTHPHTMHKQYRHPDTQIYPLQTY